jgi:hypothetical protein
MKRTGRRRIARRLPRRHLAERAPAGSLAAFRGGTLDLSFS